MNYYTKLLKENKVSNLKLINKANIFKSYILY